MSARVDEESIRRFELAAVRPLLPPAGRLLEVGAGSGLQASILREWGLEVAGVDLPARDRQARHHPIVEYDGTRLPFGDQSFDGAFSSNVMEHVADIPALLEELRRVLRPGARAVHVVPTPTWRIGTTVTHPAKSIEKVAKSRGARKVSAQDPTVRLPTPSHPTALLRRGLLTGPHGEFDSASAEIREFSRAAWIRRLSAPGWTVRQTESLGLFYTGSQLVPALTLRWRKRLARVLGGSTVAYVVERQA